jgi:CRISPR system Cascade subunit CasA
MQFNLLDEAWIPVLRTNGTCDRVGIREALTEAGSIRQIAASNPMDRVAIVRLLLAALYWCKGYPSPQEEEDRLSGDGRFPPDWFKKLDDCRKYFNLLGDGPRFFQNEGLKNRPPKHTTHYLMHEVPSGTNAWHFHHTTDQSGGLCAACCATGLARLPVFATSGGKGKSPGINSKPPLYVIPVGTTLATTLRLSWRYGDASLGMPEWETPGYELPRRGNVPLLPGMTWLPRNVWLGNREKNETACVSCGRAERVLRRCVFDGKGGSRGEDRRWRDPHVVPVPLGRNATGPLQTSDALKSKDAAAGQWVRALAAILGQRTVDQGAGIWAVGFSTVKNDKYLEATELLVAPERWPSPAEDWIALAEQWQQEGRAVMRRARSPSASSTRHEVELDIVLGAVRAHVESRLASRIDGLLSDAEGEWVKATREYQKMMAAVAMSLAPGFTTRAIRRRNQIARSGPDMAPTSRCRKGEAPPRKGGER